MFYNHLYYLFKSPRKYPANKIVHMGKLFPVIPSNSAPNRVRASGRPLKSHLVQSPGGSPWRKMPWKIIDLTCIGDSQLPSMKHRLLLKSVESVAPMFAGCLLQQKAATSEVQKSATQRLFLFDLGSYTSSGVIILCNPLRYNIFRKAAEKTPSTGGFHIQRWSMDVS